MSLFGGSTIDTSTDSNKRSVPPLAFGSTPTATPQSQSTLFGSSAFGSASTSTTMNRPLFQDVSTPASQQSQSSLFGSSALTSASNPTTPSLFGSSSTTASTAPLFGTGATTTTGAVGAFGAPATTPSLFSSTAATAPTLFGAPSSSAFAASSTPAQTWGAFGAQPANVHPGAAVPGQPGAAEANVPLSITPVTKVKSLPENLQSELYAVEKHLRDQRMKAARLLAKRAVLDAGTQETESEVSVLSRRVLRTEGNLELLSAKINLLKEAVRTERRSSEAVVIALETAATISTSANGAMANWSGYSNHAATRRMQHGLDTSAHVPESYFNRIVDELEARAHEYKREIDDIAEFFRSQGVRLGTLRTNLPRNASTDPASRFSAVKQGRSVADVRGVKQESQSMGRQAENEPVGSRNMEDIIRRQYEYFMVVASQVASVHDQLRVVKEQYLSILRRKYPGAVDPFQRADLLEKAEKQRKRLLAEKWSTNAAQSAQAQTQSGGFQQNTGTSGFGVFGSPSTGISQSQSLGFGGALGSGSAGSGFLGNIGSSSASSSFLGGGSGLGFPSGGSLGGSGFGISGGAPSGFGFSSLLGASGSSLGSSFSTSGFGAVPELSMPTPRVKDRRRKRQ